MSSSPAPEHTENVGQPRAAAADRARRMREAEQRRGRQRRQLVIAAAAVITVIIAVVAGVLVANRPSSAPDAAPTATTGVSVPQAALDAAPAPAGAQLPAAASGERLSKDGKPRVIYVGAEFCPFCAMERWTLVAALNQFGTFSNLTASTSSSSDVFPDTPTFTFDSATYTSDYLVFDAVETADRAGKKIRDIPADILPIFKASSPQGSIPWTTYGGTHEVLGSSVNPDAFAGKSHAQIESQIADPSTDLGKTALPSINAKVAVLCELTGGAPENVCQAPGTKTSAAALTK